MTPLAYSFPTPPEPKYWCSASGARKEIGMTHICQVTYSSCGTPGRMNSISSLPSPFPVDQSGEIQVAFLAARSRVVPVRQQSIPSLELCSAHTGAQLDAVLKKELTLHISSVTYWTDSTTVLNWLQSQSCQYKVFVGTRVADIQELTEGCPQRYMKSEENPADGITRGLTLSQLLGHNRWSNGPSYTKMKHPGRPHQISLHLKSQPNYERPTSVDISYCLLIHVYLMHVPSTTSVSSWRLLSNHVTGQPQPQTQLQTITRRLN
ncbi:hypothetical protein L3Q82_006497 [Scortum barcoo]|uniref:Uncharacterized protein n=1 Tax=Scortum barcoo TaxID=214431 RepID=A0ACB8WZV3_9TELE|nr:hypothetical protein L3Q82_006497 [Scortum barcoo]